jgi:uncharacterized membrane protein (DUF4010 family)
MTPELEAGIVAATAMMYLRVLVVCSFFNLGLARVLMLPMLALAAVSAIIAAVRARSAKRSARKSDFSNPLQLSTALLFALLFVVVSMLTTLAQSHLGSAGIFALAAIVGVTDIDPFVLSLAQGGAATVGLTTAASAILIATSSNNVLKAIYSIVFSRMRAGIVPAIMLVSLAVLGVVAALLVR